MNILFLTVEDVIELHVVQINEHGGTHGVKHMDYLQSAVAQPKATFWGTYRHDSLIYMSAAYLFHINKNHPFHDGNKRASLAAATTFLEMNGVMTNRRMTKPLERLTWRVAESKLTKDQTHAQLRKIVDPMGMIANFP